MKSKTVRQQVEDWLKQAPKCVNLQYPCITLKYPIFVNLEKEIVPQVEEREINPLFIQKGYSGDIHFTCANWEEDEK